MAGVIVLLAIFICFVAVFLEIANLKANTKHLEEIRISLSTLDLKTMRLLRM